MHKFIKAWDSEAKKGIPLGTSLIRELGIEEAKSIPEERRVQVHSKSRS